MISYSELSDFPSPAEFWGFLQWYHIYFWVCNEKTNSASRSIKILSKHGNDQSCTEAIFPDHGRDANTPHAVLHLVQNALLALKSFNRSKFVHCHHLGEQGPVPVCQIHQQHQHFQCSSKYTTARLLRTNFIIWCKGFNPVHQRDIFLFLFLVFLFQDANVSMCLKLCDKADQCNVSAPFGKFWKRQLDHWIFFFLKNLLHILFFFFSLSFLRSVQVEWVYLCELKTVWLI